MKLAQFINQMYPLKKQTPHRKEQILPISIIALLIASYTCLTGCSHTAEDLSGYTPMTNRRTDKERETLFEKKSERLYRTTINEIWYPFGWESPYLFVDVGAAYPVMLTSGKTFDYITESGVKIHTCMECEVYYQDNGQPVLLGTLESLSTGYPITYDETGFYVAGGCGVEKYIVDLNGAAPCLRMDKKLCREEVGLYHSAQIIDYGGAYPFLYKYTDEEIELLQLLEKEAGCKITEYIYIDMNLDEHTDLVGACKKNGLWHILYLCGDDHACRELETLRYDFCELWHFPAYDDETYLESHLLVNVYNDAGADRHFSVYALKDHVLQPVIDHQPGHVTMNDISAINQTMFLSVEDCGDGYSAVTYLHYENGVYKELGISELSESKFMQYDNAEDVLSNIRNELGTDDIRFTFYAQQFNNIRIQCETTSESGETRFCHFTLSNVNNELLTSSMSHYRFQTITGAQVPDYPLYNMYEGRLKSHFTDLDVTYPTID